MLPSRGKVAAPAPVATFQDGLGKRHSLIDPHTQNPIEVLCLRAALTSVPSFEFAVRGQVARLRGFDDSSFARVREVDRLTTSGAPLMLISDLTPGTRVSQLLVKCARRELVIDVSTACGLIRQLAAAIAAFQEHSAENVHGAIGPERLVLTPEGNLIVIEHVFGSALAHLQYSPDRFWKELRVLLPPSVRQSPFDARVDVAQLGGVALALFLGRPLDDDECPDRLTETVDSARAWSVDGSSVPLPRTLALWLRRTLQLDDRRAITSGIEAWVELDAALKKCAFTNSGTRGTGTSGGGPSGPPDDSAFEPLCQPSYRAAAPILDFGSVEPRELPAVVVSALPAADSTTSVSPWVEMKAKARWTRQAVALAVAACRRQCRRLE